MNKRYLNAEYPHPQDASRTIPGTELWIKATVKRGKKPQPPTVVWKVKRKENGDDDLYVADPRIEPQAAAATANERWAKVSIDGVTGCEYSFEVTRSKQGKEDKTIAVRETYQSWNRFFLDVEAANEGLYALFVRALPSIKAAYAEAHIEILENTVKVDGAFKRGKDVGKQRVGGRVQGEVFKLIMRRPAPNPTSHPYKLTIDNGAVSCPDAALIGNHLTITLAAGAVWDAEFPVTKVEVKNDAGGLASIVKTGSYADQVRLESAAPVRQALGLIVERTSDGVVTLRLDAAPLRNRLNALATTWDVPRATSVVDAMGAGPIDLDLEVNYTLTGSLGGQQIGQRPEFETWIDDDPEKLATVLCHELAHARGLVRENVVKKYNDARREYASNVAARAAGNIQVGNGKFYDATYGGSGTHCNEGAEAVGSCVTARRQTYKVRTGHKLCLMFHGNMKPAGALLTNGVKFCPSCLKQLRGR